MMLMTFAIGVVLGHRIRRLQPVLILDAISTSVGIRAVQRTYMSSECTRRINIVAPNGSAESAVVYLKRC